MYKTYKTMLEKAKEDNFYSKTTLISNNNGIPNGSNVCIVETYIKGGIYVKNISSIVIGAQSDQTRFSSNNLRT